MPNAAVLADDLLYAVDDIIKESPLVDTAHGDLNACAAAKSSNTQCT
jgi:hypothetical protein